MRYKKGRLSRPFLYLLNMKKLHHFIGINLALDSFWRNWHKDLMSNNIILVGLMGAGKSTIGRSLAKKLNKEFFDSDRVIEERTGVDIATIFEIEGEQGFRDREAQVIEELCQMENIVLATGGGGVLREENRKNMKKFGHVVYLCTTAELLYSRIRYDKSRPLMQTENPLDTLKTLLQGRESYYREVSDLIITTGKQKATVIVKRIEQALSKDSNNKNETNNKSEE